MKTYLRVQRTRRHRHCVQHCNQSADWEYWSWAWNSAWLWRYPSSSLQRIVCLESPFHAPCTDKWINKVNSTANIDTTFQHWSSFVILDKLSTYATSCVTAQSGSNSNCFRINHLASVKILFNDTTSEISIWTCERYKKCVFLAIKQSIDHIEAYLTICRIAWWQAISQ